MSLLGMTGACPARFEGIDDDDHQATGFPVRVSIAAAEI